MMRAILFIVGFFASEAVLAHSRFLPNGSVAVRDATPGLTLGPCGNTTRSSTPTYLVAGQSLTLKWEETLNHPGYFRIAFSPANDLDFDIHVLAAISDTQNESNDLPHQFSRTITVPSQTCAACTLQLVQYATEVPASPTQYYSCADIVIVATEADLPSNQSSDATVEKDGSAEKCD